MVLVKVGQLCTSKYYCIDRFREILQLFNLNAGVSRGELEGNLREFVKEELRKAGVTDPNVRLINKFELDVPDHLARPKILASVSSQKDADQFSDDEVLINFKNVVPEQSEQAEAGESSKRLELLLSTKEVQNEFFDKFERNFDVKCESIRNEISRIEGCVQQK